MKHPVLVRVFAVVLAILGAIFLLSGFRFYKKTQNEHAERLAYAEKFAGRIENYERLHAEVENSADYETTRKALRRVLEEHDKAAAQHKTDTAIYTATKGGLRMGEELIVSAQAQMDDMRRQLKDANSRKALLEGLLAELIATNRSKIPFLDTMVNAATSHAVDTALAGAELSVIIAELRIVMEAEPSPYDFPAPEEGFPGAAMFTPPEAPVMPELPQIDLNGGSYEQVQAAYERAMVRYQSAAAAYEQEAARYARELQEYYNKVAEYEMERLNHERERAMQGAYSEQYLAQHALWEKGCKEIKKQASFTGPAKEIRRLGAALASLVRQANSYAAAIAAQTGGVYPGMEELAALAESTAARLESFGGMDLSSLTNEEFLQLAEGAEEILELLRDAFLVIADKLNNPAAMIAELMEKLHVTELAAKALDGLLDKAEQQIQVALEEMWYQLGEQEKKEIELEAEKLGLDEEAKILAKRTVEADELKELTNSHISARLLLSNVPEVQSGVDRGEELPASARAYLDSYRERTDLLYRCKLFMCALSALACVMGIAVVPAAYELVKSRFMLLAPSLVCLLCGGTAFGLSLYLGQKKMYAALFTALFALVYLAVALPRSKRARKSPQHLKA